MSRTHYAFARAEERGLARYVKLDDLPEEFQLPHSLSRLDLIHAEGPSAVAAQLYMQICKQNIQYDLAPFNPRSTVTQLIRKPKTILSERRGTCLDLAVLFAIMYLSNDLLPLIVVVEGHAFAGLSLTRTRHNEKAAPKALAWDKGLLMDLSVLQELTGPEYLLLECTGAAQSQALASQFPEGRGRAASGVMSFERASEAGREQLLQHARLSDEAPALSKRTFLYALDIHDLQINQGFEPLETDANEEEKLSAPQPIGFNFEDKVVLNNSTMISGNVYNTAPPQEPGLSTGKPDEA